MNEPDEPEHSGKLLATEPVTTEFFEIGGHRLPLHGTSGPPKVPPRTAEGLPVRHDVPSAAANIPARTSGVSPLERRIAEGRPVQHTPGPQGAAKAPTGSGQLIGGPVRRA
ncbi:hypothetical protein VAR608DRAFT_3180 [Variovorax sp. HW608]|uniref:hypothetical protein n=1 Tax=Variovorax sp. HW608 TaxID=1034889 RepID=UPI00081FADC2|nr:hypothetical protein [Variovorax sp. HW608]SCK35239.1 hypothetical protein VAR608DRAFT_3180 [Variovorax sp. HW608]